MVKTGLPEGYNPRSWYDRMLFGAERSGLYLREGRLKPGESKASLVIENREYNLTADAIRQVASLSDRMMPEGVRSVDILLEEEGLSGPTVNYTIQHFSDASYSRSGSRALMPLQSWRLATCQILRKPQITVILH